MADLLADLARLYPPDRLLTRAASLASYESDGLTAFRARPRAVVLAAVEGRSRADRASLSCRRRALRGPRVGHQPVGRLGADRGRHRHRPQPDEPHPADRPARSDRGRRAGRDQPRHLGRRRAARPLLRARPVEPVGVHHRRQRGVQLRRRPLLPPRHDGQPRPRARSRAARRRSGASRRRQRGGGRARSDRLVRRLRGPVRRRARDHGPADPPPRGLSHRAGLLRVAAGRGRRRDAGDRRRTPARGDGDHGPPGHRGRRGRGARRLSP